MADGWAVDADQIRDHAGAIDDLAGRIDTVQGASTHIAQDDEAYGLLCGWISAILEGRHQRQDELTGRLQSNLRKAAELLRQSADGYDTADADSAAGLKSIGSRLRP
ncbi:hypothetical protein J2S43_000887 [Catenuloplanes nepalensis]|uniref:Excreted virulence factor EspC (Type VII ESX diderm) n=1 Tax=Catenuloplanes nepalensis TaxID=587533 RepID=A0ABT9MLS0_9ACTN|nr:type VII secretion target [Catenuloplanes nepalensis]MDP9792375.1 hypothetical protein [Catenuloplanes nepalensis]